MKRLYYQIPIEFDKVINMEDCKMVSLADSVAGTLYLITTTHFGECKHDPGFGCAIWEHDFDTISNMQGFKEKVKLSIEEAISTYEKRLAYVNVDVNIEQYQSRINKRRVKNRITILVKGKLIETNEDFYWEEKFFIGPLSYN